MTALPRCGTFDSMSTATPSATVPSGTPDALTQVRDLEARFATAMQELYAVGNGLAHVRFTLEKDVRRTAPVPVGARPSGVQAGAVGAPAPDLAQPGTAPIPVGASPAPGPVPGSASPAGAAAAAPAAPPPTAAVPPTMPPPGATPAGPTPAGPALPSAPAVTGPRWWERPGAVAKVLGAVGAVVTLVGVALLLAIAIRAGIFGPLPRVVSGALLAAVLLGAAVAVRRRSPNTVGAEALAATGLAAAYLDVLAASALYDFIPGAAGLVLAALLAVGTFLLARAWNSQLLAVLAAAPPALLAPAITGLDSLATMSFVALLLVGSGFAHIGRAWPHLYLARVIPSGIVLLLGVMAMDATAPVLTVVTATALGMLAAGTVETDRRLYQHAVVAAVGGALPMLLGVSMLDSSHRLPVGGALAALFLVVAAFLGARPVVQHVVDAEPPTRPTTWLAGLLSGTALLVIASTGLPSPNHAGVLLAVAAAAYLLVGVWRRSAATAVMGVLVGGLSTLFFLPDAAATVSAGTMARYTGPMNLLHGVTLTALAVLALVLARSISDAARRRTATRAAGLVGFVAGSAVVISLGTWIGARNDETRLGFFGGHATATAMWTVLAAVLVTVVARRAHQRTPYVRLGLALIAAAVAKLFLFDLSALSGLFRVVAFVITGLIVLAVGVAYAKVDDLDPPTEREAVEPEPEGSGPREHLDAEG